MQLKMLEYMQGKDVSAKTLSGETVAVLEKGTVYEVDEPLVSYLLEHRKAEKVGRKTPPVEKNVVETVEEEVEQFVSRKQKRSKE